MKSDRELLELAAKAAGYEITGWSNRNQTPVAVLSDGSYWQPMLKNSITDADGDALRLAVLLSLCVFVNGMFVHADCQHCPGGDIGYFEENTARNSGCIMTATRRAIVRAAAEIGEQTK